MTSDSNPAPTEARPASARRILAATALSVTLAIVVLGVAVLPAEYGLDPLGTGGLLRLTALSQESRQAIVPQPGAHQNDSIELILGPYQSVEYKYRVEAGASMLYSWEATRTVSYDFHSEPDGAAQGYAESFDRQESDRAHGTYTAPFSGVHGWYWENGSARDVRVRLTTAGFYSEPRRYFYGVVIPGRLTTLEASSLQPDALRTTRPSPHSLDPHPRP